MIYYFGIFASIGFVIAMIIGFACNAACRQRAFIWASIWFVAMCICFK